MSTIKAIRKILIIVAALGLGALHAEEWKPSQTFKVGQQATSMHSMSVTHLREAY
jgi:hypothetical protein